MDPNMLEWMKPFQKTFDQDFFKNFQQLFDKENQKQHYIKANLYEGYNELLCVISLPGVENVEAITLIVQGNTVEVSGNFDISFAGFKPVEQEFTGGEFRRRITLPYTVREDKVEATYRQGLLIIHLYKILTRNNRDGRIIIKNNDE